MSTKTIMALYSRANGHPTLLLVALFLKIHKNISTERWKTKLGELIVYQLYFMYAKFQNFTTSATWLFWAFKSAISTPTPTLRGYM